jgi:hypothetical protein
MITLINDVLLQDDSKILALCLVETVRVVIILERPPVARNITSCADEPCNKTHCDVICACKLGHCTANVGDSATSDPPIRSRPLQSSLVDIFVVDDVFLTLPRKK